MEAYYKYLIKIIATEKVNFQGEKYTEIIHKECFPSSETFKQGYKELSKKYGSMQIQIQTYQRIGGKWYECPKPRIRT